MMKIFKITLPVFMLGLSACKDYLDVIPDNIATIEHAFSDRIQSEKYLFGCYSEVPSEAYRNNPAIFAGDEFWVNSGIIRAFGRIHGHDIARGLQSAEIPLLNEYGAMYRGIRLCNTFIDRIDAVEDIDDFEKTAWKAEAKFLKAYYHFILLRRYGPIVLAKENLPVSTSTEDVELPRSSFGECVAYITELLDEAAAGLPQILVNKVDNLGRITQSIALSLKAKVLVLAASPLFNGNPDYSTYLNIDGSPLFPASFDKERWGLAAQALKTAIDSAENTGVALYQYNEPKLFSEFTRLKLTLRGRVPERWNSEIIWGDSRGAAATVDIQEFSQPKIRSSDRLLYQFLSPTFRIVEQYYTENGIPIDEDNDWAGRNLFALREAVTAEKLKIKPDKIAPFLHFDREPRFYADLGFYGGAWFGQGTDRMDEESLNYVVERNAASQTTYSVTGYYPKKLVNHNSAYDASGRRYAPIRYAFPIIRLADLYLLYAEALNEYGGPLYKDTDGRDAYFYLDAVRERAGLEGVVESWKAHAKNPAKPDTQEGLREIIRRERLIEMALEGHRFWDLRRWKLSEEYMNGKYIRGWSVSQENDEEYYELLYLYRQEFSNRDYLWPFQNSLLLINSSLVQNPGW